MPFEAYVAEKAGAKLIKKTIDDGPLGAEQVEVKIDNCGMCHSDLSVWKNEWNWATYPAVLGHEAIGTITALGSAVKGLKVGQKVGVGWNSGSCMHCRQCMSGEHHLCNEAQPTIVGHHGGFASHMRAHWAWCLPLPETLDAKNAGPLLCGGITVFNPIAKYAKPTAHIGIVGIGGLGHLAVKFAKAYGCEVTAFTSESKFDEAKQFGAHKVVASRDSAQIAKLAGSIDLLLVTVNAKMDWNALMGTLAKNGRMHVVGAQLEPLPINIFPMLMGQQAVSASPTGSPVDMAVMLEFAARHGIAPQTEHYKMSQINEAFEHLEAGKARYRIVLDADF